ncbi:DEAD/DEAH box helicase family protein (plasmid) [Peribacillus frigoritolerans]|uniref:DEAD/DEAH box helicase n=1 Tax=Peribacillus frigoritolerans TaxID=450367 RepID=UPI002570BA70|nr:DEAD/DEAH box helicase family protein [Peribacillus frigoritolerans]WJE45244.1 DEAD/DEAH box helicase family protein [Peribacillus frigoritolerans]
MYFLNTTVYIEGNSKLRRPQVEAYFKISNYFNSQYSNREALVVLPTGTGKSGLISIAPYGVSSGRVLIITPNKVTRRSISKTMDALEDNFLINSNVLFNIEDSPVIVPYDNDVLDSELESADIIYTNVQKLNPSNMNSLINRVSQDYFDMLIIDEAHHAPAMTWQNTINYFQNAKVLHVTGTPYRGDEVIVPGERIHSTTLSEVMEQKYVKWLRNKTINSSEIYFEMKDGKIISIDEAKKLQEEDWVKKSVALSDKCSLEIIKESIKQLEELKRLSPEVPHKIMASACNIKHAEKIDHLYREQGMESILIHSNMPPEVQDEHLKAIDNHKCQVVINVGMMGEGYDHKYLTIAALFRPYKSLNQFAQIIGRVLRAIPENEIKAHQIDNNALIIYHEELGLDNLWNYFKNEMKDIGKYVRVKEIVITDEEVEHRSILYGDAIISGETLETVDSFSSNIDFNEEFVKAKQLIEDEVETKRKQLEELGLDKDDIETVLENLERKKTQIKSQEISQLYNEKRPLERRKLARKILNEKVNLLAVELLEKYNLELKGNELYRPLKKVVPFLKEITKNDGALVIYINSKLKRKFSGRDEMNINDLYVAENYLLKELKHELELILNGVSTK